jgi:glycerol dehydrogenase-like iron-containing ADH family enzyme
MEDLWYLIKDKVNRDHYKVYFCKTLDYEILVKEAESLPDVRCIVGIGGGMSADIAKIFVWLKNLPLFLFPSSTAVNAWFTPKSGIRINGVIKYMGWAVPQAIYIDFDLIQNAPAHINKAGIGDVFCIHTGHYDWKLATKQNKETKWPWDEELATEAQGYLQNVRKNTKEIKTMSDTAIKLLMETHRWSGATYPNSGWNPRYIEGCEHFFYYNLEYRTKKKFIHGEPVCLAILVITALTDNDFDGMLRDIKEVGVRVHPEEFGVTEDEVIDAFATVKDFSEKHGLFYTVINERKVDSLFIKEILKKL